MMKKFIFAIVASLTFQVFGDEINSKSITATAAKAKSKDCDEPVSKKLGLVGIIAGDSKPILGFARKAGALCPELDGDELLIRGNAFNQDSFETMFVDSIPGAKIR